MPYYRYRGLSQNKQSLSGQVWAMNASHAQQQLEERGLSKIFLKHPPGWIILLEHLRPLTTSDQAICSRQLGILLNSGISISNCLEILLRQPLPPRLYQAYVQCANHIQQGSSLSNAMRKFPNEFSALYIGLVYVGEQIGRLPQNILEASQYLERDIELKAKIKAALTYPLIVTCISMSLVYLMVGHILPGFINNIFPANMHLPWFTTLLINSSKIPQNPALLSLTLLLLGTVWFMLIAYLRSESGQMHLYSFLLRKRATGYFVRKILLIRTARLLATGLEAGMSVSDSLALASQGSANIYLSHHLNIAGEDLKDGHPLSRCFRALPFATPLLCSFIELGEEVGNLPKVLRKAAELLELEVEQAMITLTQLLEPMLVSCLGLVIGFILIALFIPIYQMLGSA